VRARSLERTTTDHFPPRLRSCEAPESRRSRNRPNTLGPGREVDRERGLLHPRTTGYVAAGAGRLLASAPARRPTKAAAPTSWLQGRQTRSGHRPVTDYRGLSNRAVTWATTWRLLQRHCSSPVGDFHRCSNRSDAQVFGGTRWSAALPARAVVSAVRTRPLLVVVDAAVVNGAVETGGPHRPISGRPRASARAAADRHQPWGPRRCLRQHRGSAESRGSTEADARRGTVNGREAWAVTSRPSVHPAGLRN
jgi:hypothetical protein